MITFKTRKSKDSNIAFGLYGTYKDHEKFYVDSYNKYLEKYPNSIIFPIFIGELPEEYKENESEFYKFSSLDINPGYLQFMFSNFNCPVVFIGVDTIPSKNLFTPDLILSSVNIVYGRKYIYSDYKRNLSWINNLEKIDLAIIDSSKEFGVSELPANILKTLSLEKIISSNIKDQNPENFELRRIIERFDEDGFFFERKK